MDASELRQCAIQLEDLRNRLCDLIQQAEQALAGSPEKSTASKQWIAHIKEAISKQPKPAAKLMIDMDQTIQSLHELANEAETIRDEGPNNNEPESELESSTDQYEF